MSKSLSPRGVSSSSSSSLFPFRESAYTYSKLTECKWHLAAVSFDFDPDFAKLAKAFGHFQFQSSIVIRLR